MICIILFYACRLYHLIFLNYLQTENSMLLGAKAPLESASSEGLYTVCLYVCNTLSLSPLLPTTFTPHVHHMYTTCTPHVHHMYTTCTPHVQHMYTTCTPHVHYCTTHVHHMYTTCTTHVQHMYTTCTPHVHHM